MTVACGYRKNRKTRVGQATYQNLSEIIIWKENIQVLEIWFPATLLRARPKSAAPHLLKEEAMKTLLSLVIGLALVFTTALAGAQTPPSYGAPIARPPMA